MRNEKCGMRNELAGRDDGLDSKLEVPEFQISHFEFLNPPGVVLFGN
jgi:hypothetical protein